MTTKTTTRKTTKTARKSNAVVEVKITKKGLERKQGFRVFAWPEQVWEQVKITAHNDDRSAGDYIDVAVAEHLSALTKELSALGLNQRGDRRVRMLRPASWDLLLEASAKCGIPASTLMVMAAARHLKSGM